MFTVLPLSCRLCCEALNTLTFSCLALVVRDKEIVHIYCVVLVECESCVVCWNRCKSDGVQTILFFIKPAVSTRLTIHIQHYFSCTYDLSIVVLFLIINTINNVIMSS